MNEQNWNQKYSKLVNELKTSKEMIQNQLLKSLVEWRTQEPAHYWKKKKKKAIATQMTICVIQVIWETGMSAGK